MNVLLSGAALYLTPEGALFWPEARLLAVADLHLEKGSAAARGGSLVPPYDSRVTVGRLAAVVRRTGARRVVAVGDSFHDDGGAGRLAAEDLAALAAIAADVEVIWVRGNHDPAPHGLPGLCTAEWRMGPLTFRHQSRGGVGEVSGHYHPKVRIATRAGTVSRPCFVADTARLVLPAFGAYTGGLDIGHAAIAGLFPAGGQIFVLGRERVFRFGFTATGAAAAALMAG